MIGAIAVLTIIVLFTAMMIIHQRRLLRLYKEKVGVEINTLERERRRMSEDLHDELGPILAGIKLKLNGMDPSPGADEAIMNQVQDNLTGLLTRMKEISNDLMPVVLVKKGLVAALQSSVNEFNRSGSMEIRFAAETIHPLPDGIQTNLYRICQEIITNTIRHADAKHLDISIRLEKQLLIVLSEDDGKGFDSDLARLHGIGQGLRNLFNRTELLGGRMFLETSPGKGTRHRIEIPIQTNYATD